MFYTVVTEIPKTNDPGNSRSTSPSSTVVKSKWVINMPKKPLTNAQEKLLAHGPKLCDHSKKSTHW